MTRVPSTPIPYLAARHGFLIWRTCRDSAMYASLASALAQFILQPRAEDRTGDTQWSTAAEAALTELDAGAAGNDGTVEEGANVPRPGVPEPSVASVYGWPCSLGLSKSRFADYCSCVGTQQRPRGLTGTATQHNDARHGLLITEARHDLLNWHCGWFFGVQGGRAGCCSWRPGPARV